MAGLIQHKDFQLFGVNRSRRQEDGITSAGPSNRERPARRVGEVDLFDNRRVICSIDVEDAFDDTPRGGQIWQDRRRDAPQGRVPGREHIPYTIVHTS